MSWFKVALGLLSTAVGTEAGREVIRNVGSAMRKDPPPPEASDARMDLDAVQTMITRHREEVGRNLEAVVQMLNAQNQKLEEEIRRQKRWNAVLAAGLGIAIILAFVI
jgi:hypothetical protein